MKLKSSFWVMAIALTLVGTAHAQAQTFSSCGAAALNNPGTVGGGTLATSPSPGAGWNVGDGNCNGDFTVARKPVFSGMGPNGIELGLRAIKRRSGPATNMGGDYTVALGPDPTQANRAWWNFELSAAADGGLGSLDSLTLAIKTEFGPSVPAAASADLLALRTGIDDRYAPKTTATFGDIYQASQNPTFGWFASGYDMNAHGAWTITLTATKGADQASVSICVHTPGASCASTKSKAIFDSTGGPLAPNYPSLGYQATQTSEFGDRIAFAGAERALDAVTITMSTWARQSEYPGLADAGGWNHPITVNIYGVNPMNSLLPGALLATRTSTVRIPWRPENVLALCPDGFKWKAVDGNCYNGMAFNATFDFSGFGFTLPNEVIVGVMYSTSHYGPTPLVQNGPYNSLNVAYSTVAPGVGTDVDPDAVFWNTKTAGWYTDGGAAGVGVFRADDNWAGYSAAIRVMAHQPPPPPCAAGSYRAALGDAACTPAPAGSYVDTEGATSATLCPAGTFTAVEGSVACVLAPLGAYVSMPGSSSATACALGMFASQVGSTSCTPAAAGYFVNTTGASSASPCEPGSFSSVEGAAICTLSPAGTYVDMRGATSPTPCPIGMSSGVGASACTDTTAPTVTAKLVPLSKGGDDDSEQNFRVVFSSTDLVGVVSTTASLNGVTVTNGQIVKLKMLKKGAQKSKYDDGVLKMEATSFTLTVTVKDAANNTAVATAVPVFNKNGKNDEDKDGKKDEKKEIKKDDKKDSDKG